MDEKPKKRAITVNRDDLDESSVMLFNHISKGFGIPRGKVMSRAFYLVALEMFGEISAKRDLETGQNYALRNGRVVDKNVSLDKDQWLNTVEYSNNK